MKYFYQTQFGTFYIIPDNINGFSLWIKDLDESEDKLASYISAEQAADDVYMCATGFDEWDNQGDVDNPTDIHEWTKFQ